MLLLQGRPDVGGVGGAWLGEGVGQAGDDLHRRLLPEDCPPLILVAVRGTVDSPSAGQDVGVVGDAKGTVRALHGEGATGLRLVPPAGCAQEFGDVANVAAAREGAGLDEVVLLGLFRVPALPLLAFHRRRRTTMAEGCFGGTVPAGTGDFPNCRSTSL